MQKGNSLALALIKGINCQIETDDFLTDDANSWNKHQFTSLIAARQKTFLEHDIGPGKKVLLSSGRGGFFWADMIALWANGAVVIPFDATMPESNAKAIIEAAEPDAISGPKGAHEAELNGITAVSDAFEAREGTPVVESVAPEDTAAILFTSGSTGRPKGVELSHWALLGNSLGILESLRPAEDDRLLVATPFHFTSAINHFIAAALSGITLITLERKLLPADLFQALNRFRATCFGGSPLQIRWVADCASENPMDMRWVMSSGDHFSIEVINLFRNAFPRTRIFTVYGLTEVGGRFCILEPEFLDLYAGSVGQPIPGLGVYIGGEDGEPVKAGETGEVIATGELLFKGYCQNPEETRKALTPAGDFRTGDIGHLDENNNLYLLGRTDDVFKVAGKKVSVLAIAETLTKAGIFDDVAVVVSDDPIVGSVPHAFFVLHDGSRFQKGKIVQFLRRHLPANHIPRKFTKVDVIPRTGSGKIKRAELKLLDAKR